jgi:hypothetical protein
MKPSPSKSLKTAGGKKRSREEAVGSTAGDIAVGVSAATKSQPAVQEVKNED